MRKGGKPTDQQIKRITSPNPTIVPGHSEWVIEVLESQDTCRLPWERVLTDLYEYRVYGTADTGS